jgi:hypothetical protein
VRRQAPEIGELELHPHEDHLPRVLQLRPLAERLEQSGQDHRRALLHPRERQQQVRAVTGTIRRGHVHEVAHEREDAGDTCETIVGLHPPHEPAREGDERGLAGEREAEPVEQGAASPGDKGQGPERGLGQAGSSRRPSRMLFSTAGSMSRTQRA